MASASPVPLRASAAPRAVLCPPPRRLEREVDVLIVVFLALLHPERRADLLHHGLHPPSSFRVSRIFKRRSRTWGLGSSFKKKFAVVEEQIKEQEM